jgi:hypothetical protein
MGFVGCRLTVLRWGWRIYSRQNLTGLLGMTGLPVAPRSRRAVWAMASTLARCGALDAGAAVVAGALDVLMMVMTYAVRYGSPAVRYGSPVRA